MRVSWDARITARISELDFEDRLQKSGSPWAEANADGDVVIRPAITPGE